MSDDKKPKGEIGKGMDGQDIPMAETEPLAWLMHSVLETGERVPDRTGTGTIEIFGSVLFYCLHDKLFPLCTMKKTSFKSVLVETLWLLSGKDKLDFMHVHNVKHWDPWLPEDERFGPNSLGRVYGVQWRNWQSLGPHDGMFDFTDQLQVLVDGLRNNPHGRRHMVTCWNPGELDQMALPPCHVMFQCHVSASKRLSMQVYQRSVDLFIGCPYDVGIYSLILRMLCCITGYAPGNLGFNFGSTHIYLNHLDQVGEMLSRTHKPYPTLDIQYRGQRYLEDFVFEDFTLNNYEPHPHISAPAAV